MATKNILSVSARKGNNCGIVGEVTKVEDGKFTVKYLGKDDKEFSKSFNLKDGIKAPKEGQTVLVKYTYKDKVNTAIFIADTKRFVGRIEFAGLGDKAEKESNKLGINWFVGTVDGVYPAEDGEKGNISLYMGKDDPKQSIGVWGTDKVEAAEAVKPVREDDGTTFTRVLVVTGEGRKNAKDGKEYVNYSAFDIIPISTYKVEKKADAVEEEATMPWDI